MRAMDEETIRRIGIPGAVLMENAGRAVVDWALRLRGDGGEVVVVAGPGNNGGDGMVVARYLYNQGVPLRLLLCAERERVRGDALLHLHAAESCGVVPILCGGEEGAARVEGILRGLGKEDLIVDALLGTGLSTPAEGTMRRIIEAMNGSAAPRLAVDLPSGMDADRGVPRQKDQDKETPAIVRAAHTVTFAFPKLGLCGAPGFTYVGELTVADIGIPASLLTGQRVQARLLGASCLDQLVQPIGPLEHKGTHGHLLIIAGSRGKTGASLLCARGAMQVGVGLCTLASPPSAQAAVQGRVLEAMTQVYGAALEDDHDAAGEDALAAELIGLTQGKRALCIGPGIPTVAPMQKALLRLLGAGEGPVVLDADALNLVADDVAALAAVRRPLVLTPHPGEAARLLSTSAGQVQDDRPESARRLCRTTRAVVVLKGARTVIAAPGDGDEVLLSICPTGNGGMGSGGMGDVLTGILGALLCAGLSAYEAACAGVYLHGLAGDLLAAARPPGTILLAGDLADFIPEARRAAQGP
jgi:NAD(P)H-hydrate epimerase